MIDDVAAFEKSAERRADKLAIVNIAIGAYPFETCPECEGKVLERLKCLYWRVAISDIPELETRTNELMEREHVLDSEIAIHRRQVGHKLMKSREEEFLDNLLSGIAERQSSSD